MATFNLDLNGVYSYADYLKWQFDERIEIIKGKILKMSPAPRTEHQIISTELLLSIGSYLRKKKCKVFHAPFDVRLPLQANINSPEKVDTVVQPDICIICDLSKLDKMGCNGAPDLIIEILSPATSSKDLNEKYSIYEQAGVWEYWIVHPQEQTVSVFLLKDGKYQLSKMYARNESIKVSIFEDLSINLVEIFPESDELS